MGESLEIEGARVAVRNPYALYALVILTLGIWGYVWWYRLNREIRDFSAAVDRPMEVSPAWMTVGASLGAVFLIPLLIVLATGASLVRETQRLVMPDRRGISVLLGVVLCFVFLLHVVYLQRALNETWEHARRHGVSPRPEKGDLASELEAGASRARDQLARRSYES